MLTQIIAILTDLTGADEGEIQPDTELFEEGILDSFGLVQLIVEVEKRGGRLDLAELDRAEISTPAKLAAHCA